MIFDNESPLQTGLGIDPIHFVEDATHKGDLY